MICSECDKEMFYTGLNNGKEEWYCKKCKYYTYADKDFDSESFDDIEYPDDDAGD